MKIEPYKSLPQNKKIERIAYISFGVLVLFITTIIFIVQAQNKKFLKEGIRVEATVNSMHEGGTRKSKSYTMNVSLFTKGAEKEIEKPDTTGKSDNEKKMDDILSNLTIRSTIGNYVSATVSCSSDSYNKYRPGDRITVVYLKEDSTDLRILEEIE